jgi:energy-coupling factor transport system substrate-specific component
MERLKQEFTTTTWVMIPVAIALNIAIGTLVTFLKIPLYLDSVGTVLVAVIAGPVAGLVTGLLSNLIWALLPGPTQGWIAWFAPVAAVIGLIAGLWAQAGWFRRSWKVLVAGLITGFVAALLSAPISAYVFGGVTGTGQDFLVAAFRQMGASVLQATLGQGVAADPLDKAISFLIVLLIVRDLPRRFLARFPQAQKAVARSDDDSGEQA